MRLSFARHRFPPDIIRHAVWLYVRFTLSYRDVEDLLAERGLDVSYETVRRRVLKFGPLFARELRRRRHRPTSRWHLDEMVVLIGVRQFWLWRAVDDEGEVLDLLVQRRRHKDAAVKLMRKLLKKQGFAPDVLVTDKLRSYGAAKAALGLSARHEQGLRKNNRAENSHQPFDGASARCSASNRQDQPSAPSPLTPPPRTLSMPSAISHPAPRSESSERRPSKRGERPQRHKEKMNLHYLLTPELSCRDKARQGQEKWPAPGSGEGDEPRSERAVGEGLPADSVLKVKTQSPVTMATTTLGLVRALPCAPPRFRPRPSRHEAKSLISLALGGLRAQAQVLPNAVFRKIVRLKDIAP
jgi:transposase-like protein